jgi:hypothetical protein
MSLSVKGKARHVVSIAVGADVKMGVSRETLDMPSVF